MSRAGESLNEASCVSADNVYTVYCCICWNPSCECPQKSGLHFTSLTSWRHRLVPPLCNTLSLRNTSIGVGRKNGSRLS